MNSLSLSLFKFDFCGNRNALLLRTFLNYILLLFFRSLSFDPGISFLVKSEMSYGANFGPKYTVSRIRILELSHLLLTNDSCAEANDWIELQLFKKCIRHSIENSRCHTPGPLAIDCERQCFPSSRRSKVTLCQWSDAHWCRDALSVTFSPIVHSYGPVKVASWMFDLTFMQCFLIYSQCTHRKNLPAEREVKLCVPCVKTVLSKDKRTAREGENLPSFISSAFSLRTIEPRGGTKGSHSFCPSCSR